MYFVTSNLHKYEEIRPMIEEAITMYTVPYPEIQADTLEEVARYGIEYLRERVNGSFFLEDSGLFIEGLHGFPGVFSAYAYKTIGCEGILRALSGCVTRKAHFMSVIGFYDDEVHLFKGVCEGKISEVMKGTAGFGYDPIFIPEGYTRTFAEMKIDEKTAVSHRGNAVLAFKRFLGI